MGFPKKLFPNPQIALRGYCMHTTFKMELEGLLGSHSEALDSRIPKLFRLSGSDEKRLSYGHLSFCGSYSFSQSNLVNTNPYTILDLYEWGFQKNYFRTPKLPSGATVCTQPSKWSYKACSATIRKHLIQGFRNCLDFQD